MNAVRHLTGVRGVSNNLTIKAQVAPKDVKDKIVTAFRRSAEIDARRIDVEAHDSKVILRGKARSWAEKDEAQRAAWAVAGVCGVENQIEVTP